LLEAGLVPVPGPGQRDLQLGPYDADPAGRAVHPDEDPMTIMQTTRRAGQHRSSGLMWLLYLADAGLLVVGFVLARTVGIFGFRLTFSSGLAYTVLGPGRIGGGSGLGHFSPLFLGS
jgi:hypothetical protein